MLTSRDNECSAIMSTDMDFADWLILMMNEKGWTQSELARRARLPRQVINNYVNRKRIKPDDDSLNKIASALEISPSIVFRAAGKLPKETEDVDEVDQFIHLLKQFPPEVRKEIIEELEWKLSRLKSKKKAERGKSPAQTLLNIH